MDEPIKERPIEPETERAKDAEKTPYLEPTKPDQKDRDRKPDEQDKSEPQIERLTIKEIEAQNLKEVQDLINQKQRGDFER